jgi:hypothetical protein
VVRTSGESDLVWLWPGFRRPCHVLQDLEAGVFAREHGIFVDQTVVDCTGLIIRRESCRSEPIDI